MLAPAGVEERRRSHAVTHRNARVRVPLHPSARDDRDVAGKESSHRMSVGGRRLADSVRDQTALW